jgi:hypothetical protein
MKLHIAIPIVIGLAFVLTAVISAGPSGSLGQSRTLTGASGATTGAGTAGQSGSNVGGVDRHLFCNTGVITPICR